MNQAKELEAVHEYADLLHRFANRLDTAEDLERLRVVGGTLGMSPAYLQVVVLKCRNMKIGTTVEVVRSKSEKEKAN
jgi:hypothetical protein